MKLSIALLAAGKSSLFHGIKQLAEIDSLPMVVKVFQTYQQAQVGNVELFLGANAETIMAALPEHITPKRVENWQLALSESIKTAIKCLPDDITHLMVGLADQVAICPKHICQLVVLSKASVSKIIAAKYSVIVGVPAIFHGIILLN
jgi:molybdenum cofactor cytidylyltransferase